MKHITKTTQNIVAENNILLSIQGKLRPLSSRRLKSWNLQEPFTSNLEWKSLCRRKHSFWETKGWLSAKNIYKTISDTIYFCIIPFSLNVEPAKWWGKYSKCNHNNLTEWYISWGWGGCWRFLIWVWILDHGINFFSYPMGFCLLKFHFLQWV